MLSLGVRRFLTTIAAVISFFITESPMVRGLVGDKKVGHHMLSREGMAASSPKFKSKRRSDGPDILRNDEGEMRCYKSLKYKNKGKIPASNNSLNVLFAHNWCPYKRKGNMAVGSKIEEAPLSRFRKADFPK
ncbi:hypothetical protein ACFX2J_037894 [Malus domestica]